MFRIKICTITWLMLLFKLTVAATANSSSTAKLTLRLDAQYAGDTVVCNYSHALYTAGAIALKYDTLMGTIDNNGVISFTLNNLGPEGYAYVTVFRDYYEFIPQFTPFFKDCLIKAGDDIFVTITSPFPIPAKSIDLREFNRRQYQIFFTGKGASKFSMCYASFQPYRLTKSKSVPMFSDDGTYNVDNGFITIGKKWVERFDIFYHEMDSLSFQIIKADIVGRWLSNAGTTLKQASCDSIQLLRSKSDILSMIEVFGKNIPPKAKTISKDYAKGAFEIELARLGKYDSVLAASIISHYKGILRDKVFLFYMSSYHNQDSPSLTKIFLSKLTDETYRSCMSGNLHRTVGKKAFDFKLISSTGDSVTLSSLAGKIVLVDLFFKGCTACAIYYQDVLKGLEHQFKDSAVVFISISTDDSKKTWDQALKSGLYTSENLPNVINLSLGDKGMHHPMIGYYNIIGLPTAILIDPQGNILSYGIQQLKSKEGLTDLLTNNLRRLRSENGNTLPGKDISR